LPSEAGLAGRTYASGEIQSAANLTAEKELVPPGALLGLNSAIAIPLKNQSEVYGVLALYAGREKGFGKKSWQMVAAVGERVAPLIFGSIAYERNLKNALTDALTNLPNERAFFLVLENQIAESQRYREQRPLAVLSIDIKNFDRFNKKFGHARGDQMLAHAARLIKGQLRQMDFLARSAGDEFMAVLPTASEEITEIIINRIRKTFEVNPFELAQGEREIIKLNFGAAAFLKDGETAQELLRVASLRKRMTKKSAGGKGSVLWFPREYVN
jgi:diguanylate cyclase (GGDEF)-like protein